MYFLELNGRVWAAHTTLPCTLNSGKAACGTLSIGMGPVPVCGAREGQGTYAAERLRRLRTKFIHTFARSFSGSKKPFAKGCTPGSKHHCCARRAVAAAAAAAPSTHYKPVPRAMMAMGADLVRVSGIPCGSTRTRTSLPDAARCKSHPHRISLEAAGGFFFINTCDVFLESG